MLEPIGTINSLIIINKILIFGIVWRINIDNIDFTAMCFGEQMKCVKIVTLQNEIISLTGCRSNFSLRDLRKHRNMIPHYHIDCFFMLLPYKAILFGSQFTFNFSQSDEYIVIISVLVFYLLQKCQHTLALQFG